MREAMVAAGLRPPEFETNGFFVAVFYRSPEFALKEGMPVSEKPEKETGVKTSKETSEKTGKKNGEIILALVSRNPGIPALELAWRGGLTTCLPGW